MAGKFPARGEFSIPSALFDEHEWVVDYLIDNGRNCTLVYPQKQLECPNCYLDVDTNKSTGIYKDGGPIPFTNYTICPHCEGEGHLTEEQTEVIKCRVYYNSKLFMSNEDFDRRGNIKIDADTVQIVTYMTNLSKLERAKNLIVDSDISTSKKYRCQPLSSPLPHGFRHNRYIIQYWQRVG